MTTPDAIVASIENDRGLDDPARLRERVEALDQLEAVVLVPCDVTIAARAQAQRTRLEAIDAAEYDTIRAAILRGEGSGALMRRVERSGAGPDAADPAGGEGYDHLDVLVAGVLRFAPGDAEAGETPDDMVAYQPTPARHVFELLDRLALTERDVLIDLGAGLGHVGLLTAICTDARSVGFEREAAYVASARGSAEGLGLTRATFVEQDAREADLTEGSVFYLYTPFTGEVMASVLDALRREAAARPIRVCAYGPCVPVVAAESWLEPATTPPPGRVVILRSRMQPTAHTDPPRR